MTMYSMSVLETLHELYIMLTALLFDIALCIVVFMQGGGKKEGGSRFLSAAVAVTLSCALSCVSYFTGHAEGIYCPRAIALIIHLAAYMGNIFVTYYLADYIGSFFSADAVPQAVWKFNRILLIASGVILSVYFVLQIPHLSDLSVDVFAHGWFRALVGYLIELYYMIFCLQFLRKGKELNRRAKATIVAAFTISVITFAMQAALGSKPLVNYLGVSIALLVFYFAAETPDYRKLQIVLAEVEAEKEHAIRARQLADAANRSKAELIAKLSAGGTVPEAEAGVRDVTGMPGAESSVPETEASGLRAFYGQTDMLDYDETIRLLATDELVQKTARQFYDDIAQNMSDIERYLAEGDYENYTIRVHALKSSARMIGATALSEHARKLEELGNMVGAS